MCLARPSSRRALIALLGALLLLPACTSTRLSHRYRPSPADLPAVGTSGVAAARVLVSVVAVERFEQRQDEDWGVTLRLRLENGGERPLSLRTDDLLLVDAALNPFGRPWPETAPAPVAPRNVGTVQLWFPLPAGADLRDVDLEGLNLRFTLDDGQSRRTLAAGFDRYRRPGVRGPGWTHLHWGYGPAWGPRWGPAWGPGYGTVIVW